MAENEAKLILSAETQRFNQAMEAAQQKVQGVTGGIASKFRTMANEVTANTQQMQSTVVGHFDRMGAGFSKVNGILIGLAGILAGGVLFKAAVSETVELEKAAVKLGRQLGIGATEASVLQVALDDVYQDASQLEAGMSKLVKTLSTDEDAIKRLGSTDVTGGSKATQLTALKYTALSYCLTSRQTLCRQQFEKAFKLDPAFDLQPGEHGHPLWAPQFEKARKAK